MCWCGYMLSRASQLCASSHKPFLSQLSSPCSAMKTSSCPACKIQGRLVLKGKAGAGEACAPVRRCIFQLSCCGRRRQTSLADVHPSRTFHWQTSAAPPRDSRSHGVATTATISESCYFWMCFCGRRWKTFMEDAHPSHTVPWKM